MSKCCLRGWNTGPYLVDQRPPLGAREAVYNRRETCLPRDFDDWDLVMRANVMLSDHSLVEPEHVKQARELLRDPDFGNVL